MTLYKIKKEYYPLSCPVVFGRMVFFLWLHWVFIAVHGLSLVVASGGCSLVAVHRLLVAVACLVARHSLSDLRASVVAAHGLGCRVACGIFLDQESNQCPPALASWFLTTGRPGECCCLWLSRCAC